MFPTDLALAEQFAYEPQGWRIDAFQQETESQEYSACSFILHHKRIKFRRAKITPTKIGQFVTFWKRNERGPITPYDLSDPFDFFIVNVCTPEHFGQFVFPKGVLYEQGVLSKEGKGGKRAIRVYPPWDAAESLQARKTQKWQHAYFLEIPLDKPIDLVRVQQLLGSDSL